MKHAFEVARREKDQSMGLWLNEAMLIDPAGLDDAVRNLSSSGYGILRLMLRSTNLTHRSPTVIEGVARIVERSHAMNMRVVLDCEPHQEPVAHDLGSLYPAAMGSRLLLATTPLVEDRFLARFPATDTLLQRSEFVGIEAAFLRRDGKTERIDVPPHTIRSVIETRDNGFTTKEDAFVDGRNYVLRRVVHLEGSFCGKGDLLLYARFADKSLVDFWSPAAGDYFDLVLNLYRGIPLDGVGWDEPAIDGNWNTYRYGRSFAAAFQRRHGYELADKLYLLDQPALAGDSISVRLNYYETLNEGVFESQRRFSDKAREIFGPRLLLGTHHTWQGEGNINDYRAGAVDYFRLNENMDAGYTDCCWWDEKSVSYAYTLAVSLAALTPSGEAEVNTWHWKPTHSLTEYHVRLMTLLDITWFNIWYGRTTDTCLYPAHDTWPTAVQAMQAHRRHQLLLADAKPVSRLAIWHGWEGIAGINDAGIAACHKTFCLNTASLLLDRSVAFTWSDSGVLIKGIIRNGEWITALGTFAIVIFPYAAVLPTPLWERCVDFTSGGGKLVFIGPPATWDMQGQPLAQLHPDLPSLRADEYVRGMRVRYQLPVSRPEKIDAFYPLPGDLKQVFQSTEKESDLWQSGNVLYLSSLDPRDRLLKLIEPWLESEVEVHASDLLWRLYRREDADILVLVARQNRELRGVIRWGETLVELIDGTVAFIVKKGTKVSLWSEDAKWRQLAGDDLIVKHSGQV